MTAIQGDQSCISLWSMIVPAKSLPPVLLFEDAHEIRISVKNNFVFRTYLRNKMSVFDYSDVFHPSPILFQI